MRASVCSRLDEVHELPFQSLGADVKKMKTMHPRTAVEFNGCKDLKTKRPRAKMKETGRRENRDGAQYNGGVWAGLVLMQDKNKKWENDQIDKGDVCDRSR